MNEAFAENTGQATSDVHEHMLETNRNAFEAIRAAYVLSKRAPEAGRVSLVDEGFLHRLSYAAALKAKMEIGRAHV